MEMILMGMAAGILVLLLILLFQMMRAGRETREWQQEADMQRTELAALIRQQRQDSGAQLDRLRTEVTESTGRSTERMAKVLTDNQRLMQEVTAEQLNRLDRRFADFALENEQKLEQIRRTTEQRLQTMQIQNGQKLDEMRSMVDEKLQKSLEERLTQSFALVNDRLEQVYKGLGEMQTLAAGVGDLK